MRKRRDPGHAFAGLLALAILALSSAAFASDVSVDEARSKQFAPKIVVSINGALAAGDSAALQRLVTGRELAFVVLEGDAGDFAEALKIVDFLHDRGVGAIVADGRSCSSACAIALLGGSFAGEGGVETSRSIGLASKIGFRAPPIDIAKVGDADGVEAAYKRAVNTLVDVISDAGNMGVPGETIAESMRPARTEPPRATTAQDVGHLAIAVRGLRQPRGLTGSMLLDYCADGWSWEDQDDSDEALTIAGEKARAIKWNALKSSFSTADGALRTVVPARFWDGEQQWCVIDQAVDEAGAKTADCLGFIAAPTLPEAMRAARTLNLDDEEAFSYTCKIPVALDPSAAGPLPQPYPWALVPPRTPVTEIKAVLDRYLATEPVVASAGGKPKPGRKPKAQESETP